MITSRTLRMIVPCALLALVVGCDHEDGPKTSTVMETLAPSLARAMSGVAITEGGNDDVAVAEVRTDGAFTLSLEDETTYVFYLYRGSERFPLILRGDGGVLGADLRVASGGATVDVGQIHFRSGRLGALQEPPGDEASGACPDGTTAGGAPCIQAAAVVACEKHGHHHHDDGDEDDRDDDAHEGDDDHDEPAAAAAEPVVVAPTEPAAIVELGLPSSIGCEKHHEHDDGHEDED